jgi:hypothetical protein
MTAEIINTIDKYRASTDSTINLGQLVDHYCSQMDELVVEWNLETYVYSKKPHIARWLASDHIMNIYSMIIGVRRLAKPLETRSAIDSVTLRAARKVVSVIIDFADDVTRSSKGTAADAFVYHQ